MRIRTFVALLAIALVAGVAGIILMAVTDPTIYYDVDEDDELETDEVSDFVHHLLGAT